MNGPDWYMAQRLLEEQMFRKMMLDEQALQKADVDYDKWAAQLEAEEDCEHGIHPDSGHPCIECQVNGR